MKPIFLAASIGIALAFPSRADGLNMYETVALSAPADQVARGRKVRAPMPPKRPHNLPSFVKGRLVCAANVNRLLAHKGIEGTGSALAMSFLSWGRPTNIRPGAVQVERRRGGGHVKVVSHHDGDKWVCWNPSTRHQDWRLVPCSQGRAVAWRTA